MVKAGRIAIIDELRGLAILNMIVYHFLYNLTVIYRSGPNWMFNSKTEIWQEYICISFILIAGICIPYGKSLKHALIVSGCAVGISLVTYAFFSSQFIIFGILHMLGISMLIYVLFKVPFNRINNIIGFVVSVFLVILTWNVVNGYIGIGDFSWALPKFSSKFLYPTGLAPHAMSSADYFPLLPYFFVFTSGIFLSDWVGRWPLVLKKTHIRPLEYIGQHSLIIYLAHQPIILSCLYVYFNILQN